MKTIVEEVNNILCLSAHPKTVTLSIESCEHILTEVRSESGESGHAGTNYYTWVGGETLTANLDGEIVFYCHDANKNVTDLVDDTGTHSYCEFLDYEEEYEINGQNAYTAL